MIVLARYIVLARRKAKFHESKILPEIDHDDLFGYNDINHLCFLSGAIKAQGPFWLSSFTVIPRDLLPISATRFHFLLSFFFCFANCYHHVIRPKISGFAFLQRSPSSGSLQNYFTKSIVSFPPQCTYPLVWVYGASPFLGQTRFSSSSCSLTFGLQKTTRPELAIATTSTPNTQVSYTFSRTQF